MKTMNFVFALHYCFYTIVFLPPYLKFNSSKFICHVFLSYGSLWAMEHRKWLKPILYLLQSLLWGLEKNTYNHADWRYIKLITIKLNSSRFPCFHSFSFTLVQGSLKLYQLPIFKSLASNPFFPTEAHLART